MQYILSQVWPYLTHRRDVASRALAELKSNKSIVVDPKNFDADSLSISRARCASSRPTPSH